MKHWPPYFALDLAESDLLPQGWAADVQAAAQAQERQTIQTGVGEDGSEWRFVLLQGDAVRLRLGWLWELYHGPLREFSGASFGFPLFAANRLESTITLNILEGRDATNIWHTDANPVTGIFYATDAEPDGGGELMFRSVDGRQCAVAPRAGTFLCFDGSVEHQVAPLKSAAPRIALPMNYYTSATDQPFANPDSDYHRMG